MVEIFFEQLYFVILIVHIIDWILFFITTIVIQLTLLLLDYVGTSFNLVFWDHFVTLYCHMLTFSCFISDASYLARLLSISDGPTFNHSYKTYLRPSTKGLADNSALSDMATVFKVCSLVSYPWDCCTSLQTLPEGNGAITVEMEQKLICIYILYVKENF